MTEPPNLRRPDEIVMRLADRLGIHVAPAEATYLSSRNPRHRWAAESFSDIHGEFQYKAIWVAKQLRERFGPPDHLAYVALAISRSGMDLSSRRSRRPHGHPTRRHGRSSSTRPPASR